jgi:hypothetical protein
MPQTVNKSGYWYDKLLSEYMTMMERINQDTDAQAHVDAPAAKMNPSDSTAFGPNGLRKPGVELMPQDEMTRLILSLPR